MKIKYKIATFLMVFGISIFSMSQISFANPVYGIGSNILPNGTIISFQQLPNPARCYRNLISVTVSGPNGVGNTEYNYTCDKYDYFFNGVNMELYANTYLSGAVDGSYNFSFYSDVISSSYNITIYRTNGIWTSAVVDPTNRRTRIINMSPENGTTTPHASLINFNLHAYLNYADVSTGVGMKIYLHNIDQNVLLLSSASPSDIVLYDNYVTMSGDFNFSTSTYLGDGNYRLYAQIAQTSGVIFNNPVIVGCSIAGAFLNLNCTEGNTQFIVGSSTFIGNISQNSFAQANLIFGSSTATSTEHLATTCYPFSGQFDTIQCLAFLFIPDSGYISETMGNFKDNVLTHFPLGYVTDFLNILSTTTVGSLTVIDATIPNALPFGNGQHIHLDLTHSLDYILNATSSIYNNASASSTQTFYEITSYYWDLIVYICALMYIMGRILGWSVIPSDIITTSTITSSTHTDKTPHNGGYSKISISTNRTKRHRL